MKFSIRVILFTLLLSNLAYAQIASILPPAKTTFVDQNGKPLTSGTVDFYIPSTTTRKTTWQDAAEAIPNTNPVVLDAAGRALILGSGSYRQVVKDRLGNIVWDQVTSSTGSGSSPTISTGDGDLVGTIKPWAGMNAPNQYMFAYGQEVSRTTYAALFTAITSSQSAFCNSGSPVITGLSDTTNFWIGMDVELSCVVSGSSTVIAKSSTTVTLAVNSNVTSNVTAIFFPWYHGNGTTTFQLPDFRGFAIIGNNNMGGVASITMSATYFGVQNPNSIGATGGAQSKVLLTSNLPAYTPSGTNGSVSVTSTSTTVLQSAGAVDNFTSVAGATTFDNQTRSSITSTGPAPSFTGAAQGGTSTPFSLVQPSKTSNYIIKVTPDTNSAIASGVTSLGSMTGDIICGAGLLCTGNIISNTNPTPASPSPTILTLTPEQFGYGCAQLGCIPYGTGDVEPAIVAALASVPDVGLGVTIDFGCHNYNVVNPILINRPYIWLRGQGQCTVLEYKPASNNTSMITWWNAATTTGLYFGRLTDMLIVSGNTTLVKTAIHLIDIGDMEIANIYIPLWTDTTKGSIGMQVNGRQTSSFHDLRLFADKPLIIGKNPNIGIHSDMMHYWNLYLIADPVNPVITANSDMFFTNTTFDGFQSWNTSNYGFYYNGTGTAGSQGFGLYFSGIRSEEGSDPNAYTIYINAPDGFANVSVANSTWDFLRKGLYARGILQLSLDNIYFNNTGANEALNLDTSDLSVWVRSSRWSAGATQNIGGLTTIYSTRAGSPIPSDALYVATPVPYIITSLQTAVIAVGALPTCNIGTKAARYFVTDANATFTAGIGAIVAAGGANNVPVTCDGTNWRIG